MSDRSRAWFATALKSMVVFIGAVTVSMVVLTYFHASIGEPANWTDANLAESECRGEVIADAILRYRDVYGVYPPTLNDLTPAFLGHLPPPLAGTPEWRYNPATGSLSICMDGGCYPSHYWTPDEPPGHWQEDY
jgi:hypothetical protein